MEHPQDLFTLWIDGGLLPADSIQLNSHNLSMCKMQAF